MAIVTLLLRIAGGLCLFLYGMKLMSDGIQQSAGDRLRKTLNFMTGNRFAGVVTGFAVTGLIQSSSAVTVMVVSFVNAGLLTLTQSIGVIMGANIGTTVTAWIVSLLGFSLSITSLALPAVGIGYILSVIKWKYRSLGELIMGFGILFLGLSFLTQEMRSINAIIDFNSISVFRDMGFVAVLIGAGAGLLMTLLLHSSSAATAIVLTMAFSDIVSYEMAAGMIIGANIGTTIDAALAAIGTKTAAKQAALVHVLFNIIGTVWALPLIKPLLAVVSLVSPGTPAAGDPAITTHLAMLHTVFNVINTIVFLPFVKQFASLVTILIRDKKVKDEIPDHYNFIYRTAQRDTPELNVLRAEKEIRDMAGIASSMYTEFSRCLQLIPENTNWEEIVSASMEEMHKRESYADEMRESLTTFLIHCSRGERPNSRVERRTTFLIRIITDLEDMTDQCSNLFFLLYRSAQKNQIIKGKELNALLPYVDQVGDFLSYVRENLGRSISPQQAKRAREFENGINDSRKQLRKMGRKRIEAGKDVKTELFFIDLVRRVEKLGDYCYGISGVLEKMH